MFALGIFLLWFIFACLMGMMMFIIAASGAPLWLELPFVVIGCGVTVLAIGVFQ